MQFLLLGHHFSLNSVSVCICRELKAIVFVHSAAPPCDKNDALHCERAVEKPPQLLLNTANRPIDLNQILQLDLQEPVSNAV